MKIDVALDPGKWKLGLAVAHDGVIVAALPIYVPRQRVWSQNEAVNAVLGTAPLGQATWHLELPQVYGGHGGMAVKKDTQALRDLSERLGRELRPLGHKVKTYPPFTWKRQVPKKVHHRRLRKYMTPEEICVVEAAATGAAAADVWDAAGILLFGLGRVAPGGRHT